MYFINKGEIKIYKTIFIPMDNEIKLNTDELLDIINKNENNKEGKKFYKKDVEVSIIGEGGFFG